MIITDEMLRAAEWAHMIEDTCGCTNASGDRVFCDDKSLPEPDSVCHCKNGARAILEAALRIADLAAAPVSDAIETLTRERDDWKLAAEGDVPFLQLEARAEKAETALQQIARQKLTSEIGDDELVVNDIEGGYDACILAARAVVDKEPIT